MICGPNRWKEDYYSQDNNSVEKILGKLETCGPTAAINCLAAIGYTERDLAILCPGSYRMQPEDALALFMNDNRSKYVAEREKIRANVSKIPGNRIPQFYPDAVKRVFLAMAEFKWLHNWEKHIDYIVKDKCSIQLCMKKPGHYIAVVAYDDETDEMIFNNPWAAHRINKHGGHLERLSKEEYEKNIFDFCIIYQK